MANGISKNEMENGRIEIIIEKNAPGAKSARWVLDYDDNIEWYEKRAEAIIAEDAPENLSVVAWKRRTRMT